ncbi:MAG: arylamine N-acetyltransferase [Burkholderiales bacterium]|nr:arylamine N-acetyltransferase [Burkholderiales bacterium]MDE1927390.1 arylamine N-acetyltransferase [Burkholderiales bacterium]MDE2157835.1 arylamine N-acetyltransferase [Burkholderiales bacterium]MDE2504649.1 arylamine N-acetyltransferase [Burkholderiales bacterium]
MDLPDLAAYQARIGVAGALAPTRATLDRLILGHARTLAFGNIEVLAGGVPALDLASLQAKLLREQRGGHCYEHNGLFMACLRALGFSVAPLEARVRLGIPAEVATPRTHLALRVTIDGQDWLADVGFGGTAPLAALALASRGVQEVPLGRYRFVDADDGLLLQAASPEGFVDAYCIAPGVPRPIDFELGNWWVATQPKAFLKSNLQLGRAVPEGRLTLFNRNLALRRAPELAPETRVLQTRAEFAAVIADRFGIPIRPHELDAVMTTVQRQSPL